MSSRQWRLARHPDQDEPIGFDHFELKEESVPEPQDDEFVLKTIALGTSPAQRSYITKSFSMHEKIAVGDIMRGRGVGVVTASKHPKYFEGDIVVASTGWQDYSLQRPEKENPNVLSIRKVAKPVAPLTTALGILGSAGVTAYFGLLDVGLAETGNTVVVSAAAGGIGSVAGQIAKIKGCRVVGIAGGPKKCAWLKSDLNFDDVIDYKNENVGDRLDSVCPGGIDVFFDNVGGDILNTVLERLSLHARVVICGYIATDYTTGLDMGPTNYKNLVRKRAKMEGFFIFDYRHRFEEAEVDLYNWYASGQLLNSEDVDNGLEMMPMTLQSLFAGKNQGIKLCRVAPDPV